MTRPKIVTRFLWAPLALALQLWPGVIAPAHAQGTRKDDIVFNSRGIPLAGASVRVCTMPASGQPCTPLALLYSDAGLTQAIANPTTTDGLGNYFFYAAPGQYEIEISGPGITDKQIPNVILPNDPSAPTFTGAVSAFSLSLGGNLAVTGNTTVIGSMASGTVNLTNQASPPGAASAGTVNLYTKTADKRLYYKDDTGTEIGPISTGGGGGAQLNTVNTFTATQNFAADLETKGPNPYFSLALYGGYSSATATPPSTTGSISSSNTTLTLASAQDFANGQGIVIYKAGAATTLSTPGTPTVTPINLVNGSTTYSYKAIAEDRAGGLTAASAAGSTTVGIATLGVNTVTLTSCVRTSGVATYTSSSAHNLQSGTQINIAGFSGGVFDSCNGVKTIASTPTGTTFTTQDGPSLANETNTTGTPSAAVYACNTLTFPSGSFSGNKTIHNWIYRSISSGAYSLAGVAQGVDPYWSDCGFPAPNAPAYVPATPPASTQPGYLATTIVSGGGTTTLTLANAAGTNASSQTVLHDNTVPLLNAVTAADNAIGGTVYIPNGGSTPYWVFNSTADFSALSLSAVERVHINSNAVLLNQPWIIHSGMDFEGEPHVTTSYSYVNGAQIVANNAYPMFILGEWGDGVHFNRLLLASNQPQQTSILADSATDGGGTAGVVFDDVNFSGNGNGVPIVLKGGFDYFFNRGNCQGGANIFVPQSCLQLTNVSPAVTSSGPAQVPGRVKVNGLYFAGNAIDIDCLPDGASIAPVDFTFATTIFESSTAPYLRFNCSTGFFSGIALNDVVTADNLVGYGTPVIDAQNDNDLGSVSWIGGSVAGPQAPALITPSPFASLLLTNAPISNPGDAPYTIVSGGGATSTGIISAASPGRVELAMATPAAPSLAVSSGGAVPVGTVPYQVQFFDVDGNYSGLSPIVNAVTSSGNQTVTITPPAAPAGAAGYVIYRSGAQLGTAGCAFLGVNATYVDALSFTCGTSTRSASAGSSIVGPNGVSSTQYRLVNSGFTDTITANLSANRAITVPDVTGLLELSGTINAAFDNVTRANGAIGSNWTVTHGGINVASDNFVGTTSNDNAYWSANTFLPLQFSQVTLTALNGTTDFPGVAVLVSGTGTSTLGYSCIEDTTTIFIQAFNFAGTNTTLTSASSTGNAGDILRLEVSEADSTQTVLNCYKNGAPTPALTYTDAAGSGHQLTSGAPGIFLYGSVATEANWSGGNLHPFGSLDVEQSWIRGQHLDANSASCTMSSATSCTATLTSSKWHACNAQVQGTTAIAAACSISGTTLTVTAASANSQTWGIFLY
jgi:hypothetical protein